MAGKGWARRELAFGLELAALVAFAVTQPVLDLFGRAPDVFVFEGTDRRDIVAFAALFSVVPLAVLWVGEAALGLVHQASRRVLHLVVVALAVGLVAVNALKQLTGVRGVLLVLLAMVVAVGLAALHHRQAVARQFLRYAAAALPIFVALFLFASPVADLVLPASTDVEAEAVAETPPVVVLVLDELPLASLVRTDGTIDEQRYPNFARLAGLANWYPNATAVSGATWYSVPSILSGRLPTVDRSPLVSDYPRNLFTMVGEPYGFEVQEAITGLCPLSRCPPEGRGGGFGAVARRGLRIYGEVVTPADSDVEPNATFVEDAADETAGGDTPGIGFDAFERFQPDRFDRFLERLGEAPEPAVHYLHLLFPHTPWRLFPSGRAYRQEERMPGSADGDWAEAEWPAQQARQRHLLQTQYVDGLIGELLDRLEATGLLDPALLVVVADHGVAFRPGHPLKGNKDTEVDPATLPEMAYVPFFVKLPGQAEGRVDDRNALLVDVLPTVAEVLDLRLADDVDGRSVLGAPRPDPAKPWYHSHDSDFFGVIAGDRTEIGPAQRAEVLALGVDALPAEPRADLLGQPVDGLEVAGDSVARATVDGADAFAAVDLAGATLPALVTGTLDGGDFTSPGVGPDRAVAIALNGEIAAVSPVFADDGRPTFVGLVPESAFRDGSNQLELHLVSTRSGDRSAERVPLE